jgi:hypothetical protein
MVETVNQRTHACERVDFAYAFATPHRMAVARPTHSDKTLLDVEAGKLTLSWTYQDLTGAPLCTWQPPGVEWKVEICPRIDGQPFGKSTWTRGEAYLPILDNVYYDFRGVMRLEVIGGATAALIRVTLTNTGEQAHRFALSCDLMTGWVISNPAWIDPALRADALLTQEHDRADRILLCGLGADEYPIGKKSISPTWDVPAGATRTGWIIRPYRQYAADLPSLRAYSWADEYEAARTEWHDLLGRSMRVSIPDPGVERSFYACLGDLFIMREPLADGYTGAIMGTEVYRSSNPFEGAFTAIALDQVGLHDEAAAGLRVHLEMQEPDGEWADPKGWCHHMWGAAGNKAWAALEHYRLTGDRGFLAEQYPRLLASARWQDAQRDGSRQLENGQRPVTYGLMPRGMGDGGLMNDDDYCGVFYPHNFLAVYADRLACEAATLLGRTADLPELTRIYETALRDLLESLDKGAIQEDGYRWIPGTPNKTSGSRWGALYALYPCGLLPPDHDLIHGTLRHIEKRMSAGGHPIHTGWMANGCWVAISLDNLAESYLALGNGDAAAEYLYATLNHATPLYTWCEERGVEPGTTMTSGDRQHLWTPLAVVRFLRDALVMEQGDDLHLALGASRSWLASGRPLGVSSAPTHFGPVSYQMQYDADAGTVHGDIDFSATAGLFRATLHVRLPDGLKVISLDHAPGACISPAGESLRWDTPVGGCHFRVHVSKGT